MRLAAIKESNRPAAAGGLIAFLRAQRGIFPLRCLKTDNRIMQELETVSFVS